MDEMLTGTKAYTRHVECRGKCYDAIKQKGRAMITRPLTYSACFSDGGSSRATPVA